MNPTPTLSLSDAISAVKAASTTLANDQSAKANTAAAVSAVQAELQTAQTADTAAGTTVNADITTYNSTLFALIASAQAAVLPDPSASQAAAK